MNILNIGSGKIDFKRFEQLANKNTIVCVDQGYLDSECFEISLIQKQISIRQNGIFFSNKSIYKSSGNTIMLADSKRKAN